MLEVEHNLVTGQAERGDSEPKGLAGADGQTKLLWCWRTMIVALVPVADGLSNFMKSFVGAVLEG